MSERRTFGFLWLATALLAATCATSRAADVSARATLASDPVKIGDVFAYSITVEWPEGIETPPLAPGMALGKAEIVDHRSGRVEKTDDGRRRQTHEFDLAVYDLGDTYLPPMEIAYRSADGATTGVARTLGTTVTVEGVAAAYAEGAKDIRDYKDPVEIARDWRPWIIGAALGLLALAIVAALIAWLVRRARLARAARPEPTEPERPEDEVALEEIEKLRERLPRDHGEAMIFYVRLSEIVRVFLGRRYGFDGLDRTTSEMSEQLRMRAMSERAADKIENFLIGCDLVKFARHPATREIALSGLEDSRAIVMENRRARETNE